MANIGTRYNALKNEINTLSFNFKKNNIPWNAHQIVDVKIYTSHDNAVAGTGSIQTIPGASVANPATGLYQYAVSPISNVGTYYDVVSLIPESGLGVVTYINSFFVQEFSSEVPVVAGKCSIYGFIKNSDGSPAAGVIVKIEPVKTGIVTTSNTLITSKTIKTRTNDSGSWSLSVFASAISGADYRISFTGRDIDFSQIITVPTLDSVEWDDLVSTN